ncbi:MAG: efflux RND transporter permease subunit [Anaerolineae bacterium]
MWLSDNSIRQPVLVTMLMLALIVVGGIAYTNLPVDLFPNISIPTVAVTTIYPGASPQEVESQVTDPMEKALRSLNGVDRVRSTSAESMSQVLVEFKVGYPADRGADRIRERVAAARATLPQDIRDPIIQRFDPAMLPILSFAVADRTGRLSPYELRTLAEDVIRPQIERMEGVAAVEVGGGRQREIHVDLNLDQLQAHRIAPQQVTAAIVQENLSIPAGRINTAGQELLLRTPGEFRTIDDIGQVVVANYTGAPTYVRDVAAVRDDFAEVRSHSRLNGQAAVSISVRKQSGTNTVQVADRAKGAIDEILADHPDLEIITIRDESTFVRQSTDDAILDLVIGAIMASLVVLFFFRDLRNTLVTVAGLPVIIIGAFAGLNALGLSLNMITLLALALSVGLIIDDAIVVRENIFRHLERGEEPKVAASQGTGEVATSVMAMTLTVVSVFLPIAFATGLAGQFLREFGLTVAIAVLISLFEAFTLAPMLSAYFFRQREVEPKDEQASEETAHLGRLDRWYHQLLGLALKHKAVVVLVGALTVVALVVSMLFVEQAFMPDVDSGSFEVALRMPPGTALGLTDTQSQQVEAVLQQQPEVTDVFTSVGSQTEPETAAFFVKLKEIGLIEQVEGRLRQDLAGVPGLTFNTQSQSFGGGSSGASAVLGRPIQLNLRTAGDFADLDQASQMVMAALADVPGLVDLDRSYRPGKPEVQIRVDRERAASFGLSTAVVGGTLRSLISGETASRLREDGNEADIVVRLREEDRQRLDDLLNLNVTSPQGLSVPLRSVASLASSTGPTQIEHQDGLPQIVVGANYYGRSQQQVLNDVRARVADLALPAGVSIDYGGQVELMQDSFASLLFSLALSVVFIYMILASQFGSFLQPLIMMLALPLALIGAILALLVTRRPLDMTAMIGLILLMGLVVKNSILLIDFTNRLRRQGLPRDEALQTAGGIRLRPILMTSLALILGMVPVALGLGAGGDFRAPMAIAVIGGLISSTLLTLLLVPVAYSVLDSFLQRVFGRAITEETAPTPKTQPQAVPVPAVGQAEARIRYKG